MAGRRLQMIPRHTVHDRCSWWVLLPMNFATLDLNLLRVFDAIMDERSTTRAGERLGVTQSAVSHALARLRDLLGDELFIRTPAGMEPTPRARGLAPRLRDGLLQLHAALAEEVFDPASSARRFTLLVNPYACAVLLPAVLARLRGGGAGCHAAGAAQRRRRHGGAGCRAPLPCCRPFRPRPGPSGGAGADAGPSGVGHARRPSRGCRSADAGTVGRHPAPGPRRGGRGRADRRRDGRGTTAWSAGSCRTTTAR